MADTLTLEQVRDWHRQTQLLHGPDGTNEALKAASHECMADAIDAAITQRERNKEDATRLDWFDTHAYTTYKTRDVESGALFRHVTVVDEDRFPHVGQVRETIREAIDAAMAKEPGR